MSTDTVFGLVGILIFVAIIILRSYFSYLPNENHLGVIYRLGRFNRFVSPDDKTLLVPFLDNVHHEVSLYIRTAEVALENVELKDERKINVRFKVFFKTDLRVVANEKLIQVLEFRDEEWIPIIKANLEEIIRNNIFLNFNMAELDASRKSREIKRILSNEISNKVKEFGIVINPDYGVVLVDMLPSDINFEVSKKSSKAKLIEDDTIARILPVLAELKQLKDEDPRVGLLLELMSTIVDVKNLPDIVQSPADMKSRLSIAGILLLQLAGDSTTDAPLPVGNVKKKTGKSRK